MTTILFALWFFAPASMANMAPIFANKLPLINTFKTPIDFNKTFRGHRIFGDHKTIRGILAGILMGVLIGGLQMHLFSTYSAISDITHDIDYSSTSILAMGGFMGFGALFGDAVKSFFKRQAGVKPGKGWVPFDQIDFIIGGLLFSIPFTQLEIVDYITVFIVMTLLHPVFNLLGFALRLKDKPF